MQMKKKKNTNIHVSNGVWVPEFDKYLQCTSIIILLVKDGFKLFFFHTKYWNVSYSNAFFIQKMLKIHNVVGEGQKYEKISCRELR